jgi:hypothetical protein
MNIKKIITLSLVIFLFGMRAFSQSDPVEKLFQKYANDDRFTIVSISPKTFERINWGDATPLVKKTISQITAMRVLKTETDTRKIYEEVLRLLNVPPYEQLVSMNVHSSGDHVTCFAKMINNQISELVAVEDNGKFVLLSVLGNNIDLNGIKALDIGFRDHTNDKKSQTKTNTTITKNIGDFTVLKVNNGIHVKLVASPKKTVEISGTEGSYVQVTNNNGVLTIGNPGSTCDNCDIKVIVNYTNLNNIQVQSAATVNGTEVLNTSSLKLNAESAGIIKLKIQTQQLNVDASSAGIINLSGTTDDQKVNVVAAAIYEAKNLQSKRATVTAASIGKATVFVTDNLKASTTTLATIDVYGHPKEVQNISNEGVNIH